MHPSEKAAHKVHVLIEAPPGGTPFGPFTLLDEKPFSRTFVNSKHTVFLKEYRGITPSLRQVREAIALSEAARLGVVVPNLLGAGATGNAAWTLLRHVSGQVGAVAPQSDLSSFVGRVVGLGRLLHLRALHTQPGPGWSPSAEDSWTNHAYLMGRFSPRTRAEPWWEDLSEAIEATDLGPVVYLHGDLKAEHFIVDHHRVAVVDWEACARGPACHDRADALFHALRDLLYLGWGLHQLPHGLLQRLQIPGPVMAHRVLLWLDRRPPHGMEAASRRNLDRLMLAEPAEVSRCAADLLSAAMRQGVPR